MSAGPLRFIHASDFHLEQPLFGVTEVPDHLRNLFCDAPYRAAEGVFEAAINEAVDFVLLVGDIVHPSYAGPRGVRFLVQQFERLAAREIAVYWSPGRIDGGHQWPASIPLPSNVHRFPGDTLEEVVHKRAGLGLAQLISAGHDRRGRLPISEMQPAEGLYSIGLAHGAVDESVIKKQKVQYLALGGKHSRRTLAGAPRVAHYPGTHQGRSPLETGPHGCSLVEFDDSGRVRTRLLTVDVARWVSHRVEIDDHIDRRRLERTLSEQIQTLITGAGDRDLLVSWNIVGGGPLGNQLRRGGLAEELLTWLQAEYGVGSPAAWSVALQSTLASALPAGWFREDSILGDFLRLVEQHQQEPKLPLPIETFLSERRLAGPLGDALRLDDPERRQEVLREAAQFGAELLSGGMLYSPGSQETSS